MRFRTEYRGERCEWSLNTRRPVVLLGSCFAENMRARMTSCLWEAENPLGTLYNPLSIASALNATLQCNESRVASRQDFESTTCQDSTEQLFEGSLFEAEGLWRSWLFDTKMCAETAEDVRYAFAERSRRLHELLSRAEALFVTFGTAWCYYLKGRLVANCHKQPAALFERRRLTVEEIVKVWQEMARKLRTLYPQLRIVFTVSPVRHLKDGFEGNARSKAILLLAVEELCRNVKDVSYFPAYEIVNDDLRDYRFYASDLVHPSEEAVEYIWEIFKQTYIDEEGLRRLKEGEAICKGLAHRPLPNATRVPSQEALDRERRRIEALEERKRGFRV